MEKIGGPASKPDSRGELGAIAQMLREVAIADFQMAFSVTGEVYVVELLGNETLVTVKTGDALVNIRQPADFSLPIGAACGVRPIVRHLHLFDAETGATLKTGLANAA